jgi:hypothetical protein
MVDEQQNPFGGFLFSGTGDALTLLVEAAASDGLKLVPVDLGDDILRMCLPPEHSFTTAGMALVNRARAAEFGELSVGLFGGAVQPPH